MKLVRKLQRHGSILLLAAFGLLCILGSLFHYHRLELASPHLAHQATALAQDGLAPACVSGGLVSELEDTCAFCVWDQGRLASGRGLPALVAPVVVEDRHRRTPSVPSSWTAAIRPRAPPFQA